MQAVRIIANGGYILCTLFSYCTGEIFRRKAYVFKCNAAAACQWYGSFCRDFCSDITFSLPLGLLICFGRMSKNPAIRGIVSAYISVMRGTPLMLQLMVVYFGPYFILESVFPWDIA